MMVTVMAAAVRKLRCSRGVLQPRLRFRILSPLLMRMAHFGLWEAVVRDLDCMRAHSCAAGGDKSQYSRETVVSRGRAGMWRRRSPALSSRPCLMRILTAMSVVGDQCLACNGYSCYARCSAAGTANATQSHP